VILDRVPGLASFVPVLVCLVVLQATVPPARQPSRTVRFHHVHFEAYEPAAAMNEVARRIRGVRVIVPGLGVGVRVGREYVLFDRADAGAEASSPGFKAAYDAAVEWLAASGIAVDPPDGDPARLAQSLEGGRQHHIGFATADFEGVVSQVSKAGGVAAHRSEDAVLFDAGGGLLVEVVRDLDREDAYWCPMHPDVRSPDQGTCRLCGMDLVAIPPPTIGEYDLDVVPLRGSRGETTGFDLAVRAPGIGDPVTKFAVVHEKAFHLFVVSRDLSYFVHVHPEAKPDGTFRVQHALAPGPYMLIADFLPEGGTSQMLQKAVIVPGERQPRTPVDERHGLRVTLETENVAAARHAVLRFTVKDAATGEPVTDLEPYLGAPAHMLIVRSDLGDAVHAHPDETEGSGPTVSFHPILPSAGEFRLWIQFQRRGQVSTHAFTLTVPPL
jgi:hypothetical protein